MADGLRSPVPANASEGLMKYACTVCKRRKVKCDRREPCSTCVKDHAPCQYRDPVPPRRRKAKQKTVLRTLNGNDDTQKTTVSNQNQEPLASDDIRTRLHFLQDSSKSLQSDTKSETGLGRLISKGERSIYLDSHLWKTASNEVQDAESILPESSGGLSYQIPRARIEGELELDEGALLFGPASTPNLSGLHPNPVHIFKLWQTFLENVNPLTKIIHVPTLQQHILNASGNLDSMPSELEALMFAIYCAAIRSLSDEEVLQGFGKSRTALLAQYQQASQSALVKAGLLKTSNMVGLQAFVIFILSVRGEYNPHTLWSLSGIAVRIAQRIGLHRDGSRLGLSIFETEMRRRLWWQITVVDAAISRMSGSTSSLYPLADTRIPLNVNDSDLDVKMKETPPESSSATEMIFCLMRYELGQWLGRQSRSKPVGFDGYWESMSGASIPIEEKDRMIKELEDVIERKFTVHCDPSIPLHRMTMIVAWSVPLILRLAAHHPRVYHEKGELPTRVEKDLVFKTCLSVLEYGNILLTTEEMRKYLWHVDSQFPWDSLIYILDELRHRAIGDETAKVWHLIDVTCSRQYHQPGPRARSPLHFALANLAVKAWAAHVAECERRHMSTIPQPNIIPTFIELTQQKSLYSHSASTRAATSSSEDQDQRSIPARAATLDASPFSAVPPLREVVLQSTNPVDDNAPFSSSVGLGPAESSPFDWAQWDASFQEYQQQSNSVGYF
ncbi:fungal-specific transcription factor domain-containing protein [Aspergillus minisclerotigenes]|uniref:Fungal-specific transcription factor domain-containing protein n=1 Tax=Aspergillus minisclerotigenes TaxID=656917 RepID=A0A5N6IQX5_9EURO|nr:fungal-specific transcription factor domain-containing protein [Aspergillus minisclerotigenes]